MTPIPKYSEVIRDKRVKVVTLVMIPDLTVKSTVADHEDKIEVTGKSNRETTARGVPPILEQVKMWDRTTAAAYLSIPRHILIYRMKKYGICHDEII